MTDVRSLLRQERASRRIDHPQAAYTATGTLECSVCHIPLKSDTEVWNKHLKSTQHAMRAERLRLNTRAPPSNLEPSTRIPSNGSRKRKADDEADDSRKRTRPVIEPPGDFSDEIIESNNAATPQAQRPPTTQEPAIPTPEPSTTSPAPPKPDTIDEAEYAAFEADLATLPQPAPSALTAAATITAAPLTAAELAAQEEEEKERRAREREEDVAGEKEDAVRALEEEFDEMEGLEERVRRLRGRREELRLRRMEEGGEGAEELREQEGDGELVGKKDESEEGDDEDDEDFDEWGAWMK